MPIQFEQNTKRKSERFHLPAEVAILQEQMQVLDWSFEGFACQSVNNEQALLIQHFSGIVDLILPTGENDKVTISLSARARWQKDAITGFELIGVDVRTKELLSAYYRAYLDNDFADFTSFFESAKGPAFPVQPVKSLTSNEKQELNTKFIRNFILYGLLLLLLAGSALTYFYLSRFVLVTHKAISCADLVEVPVKFNGVIDRIYVKEGDLVSPGSPLYALSKEGLESQIEQAAKEAQKQIALVNLSTVQYNQARKAQRLYVHSANLDRSLLLAKKSALEGNIQQMEAEKALYESAEQAGGVSKLSVEQKKTTLQQGLMDLEQLKSELVFSKQNVHSANTGLYYTPSGIKGNLAELQANIEVQRKGLDELRARLRALINAKNNYIVRANTTGYVTGIALLANQYANAGTKILTIMPQSRPLYIVAVFPNSVVADLTSGDPVEVYSATNNSPLAGTVEHIYLETTPTTLIKTELNEVAVKISLDPTRVAPKNLIRPMSNVVVKLHINPLKNFFEKLGIF